LANRIHFGGKCSSKPDGVTRTSWRARRLWSQALGFQQNRRNKMANRTTDDPPPPREPAVAATEWNGAAPTPEDARRVWESMARPTDRRVALALTQAGKPITAMTVCRWRQQGWRKKKPTGTRLPQPLAELDAAIPVLTGDALRRIESLRAEFVVGNGLTDEDLVARGLRQLASASLNALRVAELVHPQRIVEHPDKIGVLFEKCGNALLAALEGLNRMQELRAASATNITPPIHDAAAEQLPTAEGFLEAIRRAQEESRRS
jgi:hypothetical protein